MSNNNPKDLSSNDKRLTSNVKAAGCAAKMSSAELKQVLAGLPKIKSANLLAGIDNFEDAAVYKLNDDLAMVKSMDFFPPVLDDPYLFGQIAATNALSDIYAMGGKPTLALAMLVFPTCDLPLSTAAEILSRPGRESRRHHSWWPFHTGSRSTLRTFGNRLRASGEATHQQWCQSRGSNSDDQGPWHRSWSSGSQSRSFR